MRKQTKIAAIISAAALLAIGASMTSFAATGWQEENGTWRYYNKNGDMLTGDWAKSGDKWFYLDDAGNMATDKIIEDDSNYFYVNADGAMVTNSWVEIDNSGDDDEDAPSTVWYYFTNNGKAYKAPESGKTSFKTINGKKYAFDEEGKMLFGWVNDMSARVTDDEGWKDESTHYYLGQPDDGAQMANAWGMIHVIDTDEDDEDQNYWFYFGANGKKYANINNKPWYEKTINGKKYTFAQSGKMLSEWVSTPNESATASDYKYFSSPEDGARKTKGWFRVMPSKHFDEPDSEEGDGNDRWFYADGKGKLYTSVIKSINGKKYGFDEDGEMVWGLRWAEVAAGGEVTFSENLDDADKLDTFTKIGTSFLTNGKTGLYLFGDQVTDGAMKTGTVNTTIDGDAYTFKFRNSGSAKGVGVTGKDDSAYYVNGRKVKADSDDKYKAYAVDANDKILAELNSESLVTASIHNKPNGDLDYRGDKNAFVAPGVGTHVVVLSTSGSVIKSGTKKDGNDVKLVVKSNKLVGAYIEE